DRANFQSFILPVRADVITPIPAKPIGRYTKDIPMLFSTDDGWPFTKETRSGKDIKRNTANPNTKPIVAPRALLESVKATVHATTAAQKPVVTAVARVKNRPHPF